MTKVKRKKVLRWLSRTASMLPEDTYKAFHKYASPMTAYNDDGTKTLHVGYLGTHPINHKRRMKRLYDKYGLIAVDAYLRSYGFMITNNSLP